MREKIVEILHLQDDMPYIDPIHYELADRILTIFREEVEKLEVSGINPFPDKHTFSLQRVTWEDGKAFQLAHDKEQMLRKCK